MIALSQTTVEELRKQIERLNQRLQRERKKTADIESVAEQKTREYSKAKNKAELMARVLNVMNRQPDLLSASESLSNILIDFNKIDDFGLLRCQADQRDFLYHSSLKRNAAMREVARQEKSEHTISKRKSSVQGNSAQFSAREMPDTNSSPWRKIVFSESAKEQQSLVIVQDGAEISYAIYRLLEKPLYFVVLSFYSRKKYLDFESDVLHYCLNQLRLVLQNQRRAEKLHKIQHYDQLTELCSRSVFQSKLEETIQQASTSDTSVAIIAIDVVKMSLYNSEHSIEFGNQLIKFVATEFSRMTRNQDAITRFSGDGFLLFLVSDQIEKAIDRVLLTIDKRFKNPVRIQGEVIKVDFHIGYSFDFASQVKTDNLIQQAEIALKQSKQSRIVPVKFLPEHIDKAIMTRNLDNDLKGALQNDEFVLYYQAIVDLKTNKIVKAEALIRWQKDGQLIPPMEFIPHLEDSDLIVPVGRWIIRQAVTDLKNWLSHSVDIQQVSVNLSVKQFKDESLDKWVNALLSENGLPSHCLELEVTESLSLDSSEQMERTLFEFQRMGVDIALDDFGTGYSSLSYLHRYPFTRLKIDRSFIVNLDQGEKSHKLLHSIIALSKSLELCSIAEGIETKEISTLLKNLGVKYGQGYYFNKPMPADEFLSLMLDWDKKAGQ